MFGLCIYALMQNIQATSPSQFIEDINGYRRACKSIGWEPKQGIDTLNLVILIFIRLSDFMWVYIFFLDCVAYNVIAFHANLKSHLNNVPVNSTIKFENVQLNKGNGYDPKTGIFTAPEDGVYSFAWSFLSQAGGTVYIAAVVDNADHAHTCIETQQSKFINTSGHLLYELRKGNKVWIRTWHIPATFIHGGFYTYFSGSKINSI